MSLDLVAVTDDQPVALATLSDGRTCLSDSIVGSCGSPACAQPMLCSLPCRGVSFLFGVAVSSLLAAFRSLARKTCCRRNWRRTSLQGVALVGGTTKMLVSATNWTLFPRGDSRTLIFWCCCRAVLSWPILHSTISRPSPRTLTVSSLSRSHSRYSVIKYRQS